MPMRNTLSRRRFISSTALTLMAARLRAQGAGGEAVTIAFPETAAGPRMPEDFVGLSYEVQQLRDPSFFSAGNTGLIRAFKQLSSKGVLRLGGNTSDYGYWKPTPQSPEPEHPQVRETAGQPKAQFYAVTAEAARNLAGFLDATGWTCIYGIGMATNVPERAAAEGKFVSATLGERLQYLQIGNEADLFGSHLRDPHSWGPKAYLEQWLAMARAIVQQVPAAKFGLPDVANQVGWLTQIAEAWPAVSDPPDVITLTHHYYFGGPATNPEVSIPNLLSRATAAKVQQTADVAKAAVAKMGVRLRMTEGNTCYRGGKPGLSDVFAAALWAADYSLQLACNGYSGVNLHGGTGQSVANSVGGFLPGDVMLKDAGQSPRQIASHPHPFYTPIATFGGEYALQPVAFGLKFAGALAGAEIMPVDASGQFPALGINATAYAARWADGRRGLIVLNNDARQDLDLTVDFGTGRDGNAESESLHAAGLESRDAQITRDRPRVRIAGGRIALVVPRASALRVVV